MSEPTPAIDFTQIRFPSDDLTVGVLRRVFPRSFDLPAEHEQPGSGRSYNRLSTEAALGTVIDRERALAAIAFKTALGQPLADDETLESRDYMVAGLAEFYARVGIAGEHHAAQLVRDIESQAAAQAAAHAGPRR